MLFWRLDRFRRERALPTLQHLNRLERYGVGYKSYPEQDLDSTGVFTEASSSILALAWPRARGTRARSLASRALTKRKLTRGVCLSN